jgi:hypothetical protein
MERKIGEIFAVGNYDYIAQKANGVLCEGCHFHAPEEATCADDYRRGRGPFGKCWESTRSDRTNIIFKRLERKSL